MLRPYQPIHPMEMRVDYGPGYRIYFTQQGPDVVILLCGGDMRATSYCGR
jgi:putative addiction module killer protein